MLDYPGGLRYPKLVRVDAVPDRLSPILAPKWEWQKHGLRVIAGNTATTESRADGSPCWTRIADDWYVLDLPLGNESFL